MMRQRDIDGILRSGEAVPGGQVFAGSTTSTRAVQLSRVKKRIEREGNTVRRVQCYRLPQCELPAGLERSPVLFQLASALAGSTALSVDQLAERVWSHGASDNDVWNAVDRLRDWGLNVVSTGYYRMMIKI
jgi:biotin operon repressor